MKTGIIMARGVISIVVLILASLLLLSTTSTTDAITPKECMMCKFSVSLVNYALRTQKGADQVGKFANSFCNIAHIESPLVCSNITRLFNHEIIKVLSNALITPNQVCGYISNNTCGHYNDPLADWEVNLDASTSLNQAELEKLRLVHQKNQAQSRNNQPLPSYRVIHLSDTHIDLSYTEDAIVNCNEPLCCRKNSTKALSDRKKSDEIIKAGRWGSFGTCDVPLRTFENVLSVLNSTIKAYGDIDYIIWTGDIQPHDVWQQDKATAIDTYDTVFGKIFEYLPTARIFPTLGNHEMIPVDSFSPSNLLSIARDDSPEWLYRKLDSFWSRWLPIETVQTITKDGFYATNVKPGLKLISLNTNFCHNKNFWLYINATDPGNQLQWLVHELQISELQHEQVHIIGHIPPGTNDCLKIWSKNYNKIVRRFARTISAQFFGHTHNNEFEIFYDKIEDALESPPTDGNSQNATTGNNNTNIFSTKSPAPEPISLGLIGPSVTTFIDLNPSFRIYTIDSNNDHSPVDFETVFMNLTAANLNATSQEPNWQSILISKDMDIPNILPKSMHNLMLELVDELKVYNSQDPSKTSQKGFKLKPTRLNSVVLESSQKEQAVAAMTVGATNKLFKLYRMFHNYSDKFGLKEFNEWTIDQKKSFLCKFFSSQSHNTQACKRFISDNVLFDYVSVV